MPDIQHIIDELQERFSPSRRELRNDYLARVPRIVCGDGFGMSVQTGYGNYCQPRDNFGPWHSCEIGFPSQRVEALMPYIDGGEDTDPTDTVYGYVPLTVVAQVIADHGGFAASEKAA